MHAGGLRHPTSFVFMKPANMNGARLMGILSRRLFSAPRALVELSVSRFVRGRSMSHVVNTPPKCINCSRTKRLARGMEEGPCSIILFSRVRGTRPSILGVLLRVLSSNGIASTRNEAIGFRGAVIIVASGTKDSGSRGLLNFNGDRTSNTGRGTLGTLRDFLHPRFVTHISRVIMFSPLSGIALRGVTSLVLSRFSRSLGRGLVSFDYSGSIYTCLTRGYSNVGGNTHRLHGVVHHRVRTPVISLVVRGNRNGLGGVDTAVVGRGLSVGTVWGGGPQFFTVPLDWRDKGGGADGSGNRDLVGYLFFIVRGMGRWSLGGFRGSFTGAFPWCRTRNLHRAPGTWRSWAILRHP